MAPFCKAPTGSSFFDVFTIYELFIGALSLSSLLLSYNQLEQVKLKTDFT
jgi:hypothetical protein